MKPDAPFTDNYRFTGPTVAISCEVNFDKEAECWVAKGSQFVGEGGTPYAAALNCFRAWMTNDRGWFSGGSEDG